MKFAHKKTSTAMWEVEIFVDISMILHGCIPEQIVVLVTVSQNLRRSSREKPDQIRLDLVSVKAAFAQQ
jgi:hypothetical protein